MIPLLYILPTDEVYTEASGIIKDMSVKYSNNRKSIQIEFQYNLDEFFFMDIYLTAADQPEAISLYTKTVSEKIYIDDLTDNYTLQGDSVAISMTKDMIISIVENTVTYDSFKNGTEIKLRIIQESRVPSERPAMSSFSRTPGGIRMTIEGEQLTYIDGDKTTSYRPYVLIGGKVIYPRSVDGHYFIFDLVGNLEGLSFVAIAPFSILKSYIFKQQPMLENISIDNDGFVSLLGLSYGFKNGIITTSSRKMTFQKFLDGKRKDEWKKYLFNVIYDKNLYTEISLLIPTIKHNSMTVYAFGDNILAKGRTSFSVDVIPETGVRSLVISIDNPVDIYGRKIEKKYELIIDTASIFSKGFPSYSRNIANNSFMRTTNSDGSIEYDFFDDSGDVLSKDGYLFASNKKIFVSVKESRLYTEYKRTRGSINSFRKITDGDFMMPSFSFSSVDFEKNKLITTSGSKEITKSIDNLDDVVASTQTRLSGLDALSDFAGVYFNIPPVEIKKSAIGIDNFGDIVLLCRTVEEPSFGVSGIRDSTDNLFYNIVFNYELDRIFFVYDIKRELFYCINFRTKEVYKTTDSEKPQFIDKYFSSVDFDKLKMFLLNGGFQSNAVKLKENVYVSSKGTDSKHSLFIGYRNVFYENGIKFFSIINGEIVNIDNNSNVIVPSTEKSSFMYKKTDSAYRYIFSGVLCNANSKITEVKIENQKFYIGFKSELGTTGHIEIDTSGGAIELKRFVSIDIETGDEMFSFMSSVDIKYSDSFDSIEQVGGLLVFKSNAGDSYAIDIEFMYHAILSGSFSVNNSFFVANEEYFAIINKQNASSYLFSSGEDYVNGESIEPQQSEDSLFVKYKNSIIDAHVSRIDEIVDAFDGSDNVPESITVQKIFGNFNMLSMEQYFLKTEIIKG